MRAIVKNLTSMCFFALIHCAGYANASEEDDFVASNIISGFYHELGHAVIDMMGVPIFRTGRGCGRRIFNIAY